MKKSTTIRLTDQARGYLEQIGEWEGENLSQTVERLIRQNWRVCDEFKRIHLGLKPVNPSPARDEEAKK